MHRLFRRTRRGMTLVELAIASGLMLMIIVAVMALFIAFMRQERSNVRALQMSYNSAQLHRELRRVASIGAAISTSADSVRFENLGTGTISELRYEDLDNNPNTIGDNRILFDPDVDTDGDERVVIRFVSPLVVNGVQQPIFRRMPGTPSPLAVEFRIGDRTGPISRGERTTLARQDTTAGRAVRADDAWTGAGLQSQVYRGVFMPRVRL
ncbi:MAG: type II secretion system protein [Candidatus Sumerlaeia bacterium]|nr:type II secretion system protein [Candidatus Sumerlaeia bacterium]